VNRYWKAYKACLTLAVGVWSEYTDLDRGAYVQRWERYGGKVLILEPELRNSNDDRK
jgi:hypothetical protein